MSGNKALLDSNVIIDASKDRISIQEIIDIGKKVADTAVEYRKIRKIKLTDALVLATAKIVKADLITSNISDFQNIDNSLNIIKP